MARVFIKLMSVLSKKSSNGFYYLSTLATLLLFSHSAWSFDWTVQPRLNVEQIYSDNIRLASVNKQSALVTEVSPGISINGNSPISDFDLSYRAQGLYNAQGDSGLDINNQLQMDTKYTFVPNKLFVDSGSSISQQNVSNRRLATDNISGSDSTTTVSTFHLSPYWTPHFQGLADAELRVIYDRVDSEGGNTALSKTNSLSQSISLTSGSDFTLFSWSLAFNNSNRNNTDGENVNFQNSSSVVRYAFSRELNVFARTGHSSNSFSSNSNSNQNGISYSLGGQWKPSQRFSVEAGYGNSRFVTVDLLPFNRLHWVTTYTNNDIGLNTGGTWNTSLDYTTRRAVWGLRYSEQTTTTQQLLLDQQIFSVGEGFDDRNTALPSLTDEVFISKQANISVTFSTGKSSFSADLFRTTRTFEQSQTDEKVIGLSGSWRWQFIRRSTLSLRSSWQQTKSDGISAFSDKQINFSARVTRNIFSRVNANVEYRFVDQSSNDNLNSYSENRVTANLTFQF